MPREPWSAEEDEALRVAVALHGPTQWHLIAAKVGGGRKPTQCNARWHNYLRPGISLAPFTAAEDDTIVRGVERYGTTWRWIAAALPARTPHAINNRWYRLDVAKKRQPSSKWTPPPILPSAASPPTLQEDERAGLAAFDPEAPRASDVGDPDPVRGAKVKEIVKEYFTSQQLHLSETHMQRLADFVYEDKLSDFVVKGRTAAFATIKIPETWRSLGLPLPKHMAPSSHATPHSETGHAQIIVQPNGYGCGAAMTMGGAYRMHAQWLQSAPRPQTPSPFPQPLFIPASAQPQQWQPTPAVSQPTPSGVQTTSTMAIEIQALKDVHALGAISDDELRNGMRKIVGNWGFL